VRYADNWLLFGHDKTLLHDYRQQIANFLIGLRLVLHERKTQVYPTGIPSLGFCLYPTHLRLKRPNLVRFKRRMHTLLAAYAAGELPMDRIQSSIDGWIAHTKHGSTYRLRAQVMRDIGVPRRGIP
jgi:hypothetical protein